MSAANAIRLTFVLAFIGLATSNTYTCDTLIDCDPANNGPGEKVPDIRDCNKYYTCLDGGGVSPISYSCEYDEYFSEVTGECEYTTADCTYPVCAASTRYCELDCFDSGFIPVAGNPSGYWVCGPGPVIEDCEEDLVFDGTTCTIIEENQCDTCIVRCDPSITAYTIVNPFNCNEFITCNSGVPEETYSCGAGMFYDNLQGNCVEGTCTSYCP